MNHCSRVGLWIKPLISAVEWLQFFKFGTSLKCSSKPKFLKSNDCIFYNLAPSFVTIILKQILHTLVTYITKITMQILHPIKKINFSILFYIMSYPPLRFDLTTSRPHINSLSWLAPWPTRPPCLSYNKDLNNKMSLITRLNMEQWNVKQLELSYILWYCLMLIMLSITNAKQF